MKAVKRDAREMKDSGIEWIGKIPNSWELRKTKYVADFNPKVTMAYDVNQPVGYVPMDSVKFGYMEPLEHEYNSLSTGLTQFQEEDIVMAKVTPCFENGEIAIAKNLAQGVGLGSSELFVYRAKEIDQRYFFYYLQHRGFIDRAASTMTGVGGLKRVSSYFANNAEVTFPCIEEQQSIADYLDDRCAKIDAIIAEAKASIEEYKELKQAVIYEAVTKGLDKNVEMIAYDDWFDKCPSKWNYEQIRYLYELRDERNFAPLDEVNLISLYTDRGVMQHADIEKTSGNKAVTADGYKKVYLDDIVVNIILCWMGAMGRSEYQGVTSPAYDVYKPLDPSKVCSRYYHYLFRTDRFSKKCYTMGRGIMMMRWRTYSSQFRAIKVPVPSYEEQVAIADFLDMRIKQTDELIDEKQSLIDDLEAYKKSLIYEVVTGKRKVVAG